MTWTMAMLCCFLLLPAPFVHAGSLRDAYKDFEAGKFAEAAEAFKQQTQKEPQNFEQLYNTGVALYQKGDFAEATNYFDRAKQSPDPKLKSEAAYNKGLAMAQQKRWDMAESEFQEALSYDNDNSMIQDNLRWAQEQKKQQKPEDQKDQKSSKNDQADSKQQQAEEKPGQKSEGQPGQQGESKQQNQDGKSAQNSEKKREQNSADKSGKDQAGSEPAKLAEKESDGKGSSSPQEAAKGAEPHKEHKADQMAQQKQQDDANTAGDKNAKQTEMMADGKDGQGGSKPTSSSASGLTVKELKKQEAEKLLRSVDDRIGSYILTPDQTAVEGKSRNGKDW